MSKQTIEEFGGSFKVGDVVWFVTLEQPNQVIVGEKYEHLLSDHPIFLLSRSPMGLMWSSKRKLPKLENETFDHIVNLLTCTLVARSMLVDSIELSDSVGEYIYHDDEFLITLPENVLFKDRKSALREISRTLNMIKDWVDNQLGNNHEMFSMRRSGRKQQNRVIDSKEGPGDIKKSKST